MLWLANQEGEFQTGAVLLIDRVFRNETMDYHASL
jgi:hypothetical protein